MKLNDTIRRFILNEGQNAPSLASYIQSLQEIIFSLSPRTQTERRRVEMAKNHLREVKRHVRKLEEKVQMLEEQINESKGDK
tara:strand:- start:1891 stop:2136 length:246 start_codon:yes stop_codon:yes gene_type:complete